MNGIQHANARIAELERRLSNTRLAAEVAQYAPAMLAVLVGAAAWDTQLRDWLNKARAGILPVTLSAQLGEAWREAWAAQEPRN